MQSTTATTTPGRSVKLTAGVEKWQQKSTVNIPQQKNKKLTSALVNVPSLCNKAAEISEFTTILVFPHDVTAHNNTLLQPCWKINVRCWAVAAMYMYRSD